MKNQLSALMDGELDDDEAHRVLRGLKEREDLRADWAVWHLIGDNLRGTPAQGNAVSARLAERLAAEPTVLAPPARPQQKRPAVSWALAASLAAVSLVAWTAFQLNQPDAAVQRMSAQQGAVASSGQSPQQVNAYLSAHQEYSVAALHGASPYLQASLEIHGDAGK
jgi:sigma-E factor negative regulatory protein RseA